MQSQPFDPHTILKPTDAMLTEDEASYLYRKALRTANRGWAVNVGVYRGGSTCCIASAARQVRGKVLAVDPHQMFVGAHGGRFVESDRAIFLENVSRLGFSDYVHYERSTSQEVASIWREEVDLAFIDGDHSIEAVAKDVSAWKNHLRVGGIIALHDANDGGNVDQAIGRTLLCDTNFLEIRGCGSIRSFIRSDSRPQMILCCGLQSGGTTIVSWCFLQRRDTSGILDMWTEGLELLPYEGTPLGWCKMTISCFRWQEAAEFYERQGWTVKPLMVVRDVRTAYASLRTKQYGINGITAEDPPLRTRLTRFLSDWRQFKAQDWPIIKFESFIQSPRELLMKACADLRIPYYDDMVRWPKMPDDIEDLHLANATFRDSVRQGGLLSSLRKEKEDVVTRNIPLEDLAWLEQTFLEYNSANDYPEHMPTDQPDAVSDWPTYYVTQRCKTLQELDRRSRQALELERSLAGVLATRSWRMTIPLRLIWDTLSRLFAAFRGWLTSWSA